jgi:GntR family transcriptional regulator
MVIKINSASGVPIYLQLMEQIKHAIEIGALKPGDQLPAIRSLAEELVMNPNTVARAYRDLQHEGVLELRHGSGAFVSDRAVKQRGDMHKAQAIMQTAVEKLHALGLAPDEMRRLFEAELFSIDRTANGRKS